MFFYWFLGGRIIGFIVGWLFKFWNSLDSKTKKLIIEQIIKAFEEILRVYYKWDNLDNHTKKLIIERVIEVLEIMLRAFYKWWKDRGDK